MSILAATPRVWRRTSEGTAEMSYPALEGPKHRGCSFCVSVGHACPDCDAHLDRELSYALASGH